MVTVFDGQLQRTWKHEVEGVAHVVNLYHDTITGVRSATLNHEEILGSLGTSNLFMESTGHRIIFNIQGVPAFIEIKRSGWVSFEYSCCVDGVKIPEVTQKISETQNEELYNVKVGGYTTTRDSQSAEPVVWYKVEVVRREDGCRNVVHRRFKDFSALNSEIKQCFKGHHLLSSLPAFVEKKSKWIVDHSDPHFLDDRAHRLQIYLECLVRVPHVSETSSIKGFLGMMEKVRETSVVISSESLGFTLSSSAAPGSPAVVASVTDENISSLLSPGDFLSKISGQVIGGFSFSGIETCLKHHPRPFILHFVQPCRIIPDSNENSGK